MKYCVVSIFAILCLHSLAQVKRADQPPATPTFKREHAPVQTKRAVPQWAKVKLRNSPSEFRQIREEIWRTYGKLPEDAFIDKSVPEAALAKYLKSKAPQDAYRALYLWICSGESYEPAKYEALWKSLPVDDFEVARLHLIWSAPDIMNLLTSFGDEVLARDKSDLEVMYIVAMLRSSTIPELDLPRANSLAMAVLQSKRCPSALFRAGQVRMTGFYVNKSESDGRAARALLTEYLHVAKPKEAIRCRIAKSNLDQLKRAGL